MMNLLRGIATALALHSVGATLSHFAVAMIYAWSWANPYALGRSAPDDLTMLVFVEFLFMHSGVMLLAMRASGRRWPAMVLAVLYVPFAIGLASRLDSRLILAFFAWHLVSMAWSDLAASKASGVLVYRYAGTVVIFLMASLVAILPWPAAAWASAGGAVIPVLGTLYFTGRTLLEVAIRYAAHTGDLARLTARLRTGG